MHTKWWLKIEDGAILLAAVILCFHVDARWYVFAGMALAPDLGMLGYLVGPRLGAWTYNLTHIRTIPIVAGLVGISSATPVVQAVALVWIAHIAFDRIAGYGLKMPSGFRDTHLGTIGGARRRVEK